MEDNLIVGEGLPDSTTEEVEVDITPSSDYEYILAACNAYEMAEACNPMSKTDSLRVNRIKRKSIAIIDYIISTMYDELFDKDEED